MNRYSKSLILNINLAHLSQRYQMIRNFTTNVFKFSPQSQNLLLNEPLLINLNNQRNYKMAYRGLTKDFKKTPRKTSKEKKSVDPSSLFKSIKIMPNLNNDNEPNLGEEIGGKLEKRNFNN